jgi:hypothetical protein
VRSTPTSAITLGAACVSLTLAAACGRGDDSRADSAAATTTPAPATADPDRAAAGANGLPAGYLGRTDRADAQLSEAKYAMKDGMWDVTTGPHHIIYAAKDSASGNYVVSSRIDQLETPQHPEAFGIFIGGQNLDQPTQKYTYFMVRGTGDVLVKRRDGANTNDIVSWAPSAAVPKQDASGKASYRLSVRVESDSVRFFVNDKPAAAIAANATNTSGIAGVRIGHNLHVLAQPVRIDK